MKAVFDGKGVILSGANDDGELHDEDRGTAGIASTSRSISLSTNGCQHPTMFWNFHAGRKHEKLHQS
jgi:hypothetical protein